MLSQEVSDVVRVGDGEEEEEEGEAGGGCRTELHCRSRSGFETGVSETERVKCELGKVEVKRWYGFSVSSPLAALQIEPRVTFLFVCVSSTRPHVVWEVFSFQILKMTRSTNNTLTCELAKYI